MALIGVNGDWLFLWRLSKWRKDEQSGVECTLFRNESAIRSSTIIAWAEEAWDAKYGPTRKFTYVNPRLVRSSNPGCCFKKAGYKRIPVVTQRKLLLFAKDLPADSDHAGRCEAVVELGSET